ncbi:MAG: M13 family metallopeptidase [Muribaculaceae bacterium]|nr:M13 family metallopeptidase [Muribaculaceae bacterium]
MRNKFLNILGVVAVIIAITAAYFMTKEKVMTAGINTQNMDLSVNPGDNFYEYATGTWRKNNPIPDDYTRYGTFEILHNKNLERVREIAENDNGKIGMLYRIAMDSDKLNADGTSPVAPYLAEIDKIKSADDLPQYLGTMHRFASAFWGDGVGLDEKDSEHYLYNIVQGGLGLSRDYYFDGDEKSVHIRKKYKEFIAAQSKNFGLKIDANKIYALEERMAKSFFPKEKLRDPHANYHKLSIDEVKKQFAGFDWDAYLTARGAQGAQFINIGQPSAISESIAIMRDTDIELIKDYLKYRIITAADSVLDDKSYDISFDFYNRTMAGQETPKPRWKRVIGLLDDSLGEEIGHLYVDKYFPPVAKARMEKLVKNLQRAYKMRIENLTWMSDDTRKSALKKLDGFNAKIGYPDKWRDYTGLEIKDDSLWENVVRVAKFEDAFWLAKIGGKKDPNIWYMNAHEINAYYDPSTNEICFPAGILQYPFFDMTADDAFNYGAIGSIIGHEMTHGFDDSGRQFDVDGNLRDWWTTDDADGFEKRANVMREFFNKIEIAPGIFANGEFTLGENLADYGGVTISYTAFDNFGDKTNDVAGLSPQMRFFIAYAGTWAQNMRDAEALRLTKMDEHSLGHNRVNGILPHIDAWYNAFNVTSDNKMYITPEQRVRLW